MEISSTSNIQEFKRADNVRQEKKSDERNVQSNAATEKREDKVAEEKKSLAVV